MIIYCLQIVNKLSSLGLNAVVKPDWTEAQRPNGFSKLGGVSQNCPRWVDRKFESVVAEVICKVRTWWWRLDMCRDQNLKLARFSLMIPSLSTKNFRPLRALRAMYTRIDDWTAILCSRDLDYWLKYRLSGKLNCDWLVNSVARVSSVHNNYLGLGLFEPSAT